MTLDLTEWVCVVAERHRRVTVAATYAEAVDLRQRWEAEAATRGGPLDVILLHGPSLAVIWQHHGAYLAGLPQP